MRQLIHIVVLAGWAAAVGSAAPAPLRDKTLVAWICLADTAQRAGSALTLIDQEEHFDAIVFGEVSAGKWMAGSDFFRRTHQDQAGWAVETAGPKTPVQVAITYRGERITLFRNGQEYAAYPISQGQAFGGEATVLIGLRYLGGLGEIGFLAGEIEDARIYDVALTPEQIGALRPNQASSPAPLAWWSFENGQAGDLMKTFPAGRLEGGARVANGRLVLDGGGYLRAARDPKFLAPLEEEETPLDTSVQTLFYKARSKRTGNMWDTWLYWHEGTYYLYCLANARGQWDNISLARSPDGVHWRETGRILSKGRGVTWMGTGSTWKSPNHAADGKFFMNFSEWKGPRQTIFFAESKDLGHWTRLPGQYEFKQDERWYERNGRWDCIYAIPRPGGGLYGYWTATPKAGTGGRFGFGESADGVTWAALPPPRTEGVGEGEAGAVERIGGKYYMMFGAGGQMSTLVADRPEGPFVVARKNPSLLSGHTYFSRFFPSPQGVLVNHHSIARNGQVYFGLLKRAVPDAEGTLRLAWWEGYEGLKREVVPVLAPAAGPGAAPLAMLGNGFDMDQGLVLEGVLRLPTPADTNACGLYLEHGPGKGIAIRVGAGGITEIGPMAAGGAGFKPENRVDRELSLGPSARFRLVLKLSLLEFYLDDILIQCFSLPERATGRIGLVAPGRLGELKAWQP